MANTITQDDVLNSLHNLMGHRVNPGGTDDDLKRFVQQSFNYCWRYYKWNFSLKKATVGIDGLLPADFDYEGYREFDSITEVDLADTLGTTSGSALTWDDATGRYKLDPVAETDVVYQKTPPTLGTDAVPFPSAQVVALGATIYAKQAENPTRADITQEWDTFHSELDRLVGRADFAKKRRPVHYLDAAGTYTGDTGS